MSEPDRGRRAEVRRRFLAVDSANVSDVLDAHGLRSQVLSAQFTALSGNRVAGWAFTISGSDRDVTDSQDQLKVEACSAVGPDEVTVWAGGGGETCFLGELIGVGLMERGGAGAVVHGGTRDLAWLRRHGFAVFGTARSPVRPAGRWSVNGYGGTVELPGIDGGSVHVSAGDFLLGDDDGVVVVPAPVVDEVLLETERLTRHEEAIRADLADGLTLVECLARHGKV